MTVDIDALLWWRDESPYDDEMILLPFPHVPDSLVGSPHADNPWWNPLGTDTPHPPEMVKEWQWRIIKWYTYMRWAPLFFVEGTFDLGTTEMTKTFQVHHGLATTGVVDKETDFVMLEFLDRTNL